MRLGRATRDENSDFELSPLFSRKPSAIFTAVAHVRLLTSTLKA
jgi:hypothetical protein